MWLHIYALSVKAINTSILLSVFVGGGLGSLLRMLMIAGFGNQFYVGTLLVNLTGSFFIGFIFNSESKFFTHPIKMVMITGILGGLAMFSGFALDFFKLAQMGEFKRAFLFFVITNLLVIGGCVLGYFTSVKS
jgi:CrcB protein